MQLRTRQKRKVLINITPLIDVLFLLLIFFMVSSTFLEQPGIKLELPAAQSAVVVEQKDYVLFVDKESNMFLNDKAVRMQDLETKIKEALPGMKDMALVLKADQEVSHGFVVKIMDIAKRSGVKKLIIGTKLEK
jgi:biopolymer transport protein ExbD